MAYPNGLSKISSVNLCKFIPAKEMPKKGGFLIQTWTHTHTTHNQPYQFKTTFSQQVVYFWP